MKQLNILAKQIAVSTIADADKDTLLNAVEDAKDEVYKSDREFYRLALRIIGAGLVISLAATIYLMVTSNENADSLLSIVSLFGGGLIGIFVPSPSQ